MSWLTADYSPSQSCEIQVVSRGAGCGRAILVCIHADIFSHATLELCLHTRPIILTSSNLLSLSTPWPHFHLPSPPILSLHVSLPDWLAFSRIETPTCQLCGFHMTHPVMLKDSDTTLQQGSSWFHSLVTMATSQFGDSDCSFCVYMWKMKPVNICWHPCLK